MRVTVLYFAALRERLGPGELVDLSAVASEPFRVRELMALLGQRSAAHAEAFAEVSGLRAAMNLQLCGPDTVVSDGAELAFFPPVTGG
jgi:molybdopterin synthase sulfur carrier subunit